MIRAKLRVRTIAEHDRSPTSRTVTLQAVYDTSIPEDQRFFDATPSASFELLVNNPKALEELKLGRAFYLDFVPIEEP